MAWLFTQVWLWSLAAFLVGSVLTWLLFVRPTRRRLLELEAAVRRAEDDREWSEPTVTEEPAWELLRSRDEWESEPAGDRPFRTGRVAEADEEEPVTAVFETASGEWADDSELRLEEQRELAARQEAGGWQLTEPVRHVSRPTAPPELDRTGTELADEEPGTNSWFDGSDSVDEDDYSEWTDDSEWSGGYEWSGTLEEAEDVRQPGEREPDSEYLSGRLRSLFEPWGDSGADEPRAVPYVPPVGAETTRQSPPVDDDRPHEAAAEPEIEAGASAEAPQETGYEIKGHFASRQYHTPDSPRFDRIAAQVWFRTAADAEQAGFEPWDGRRRS